MPPAEPSIPDANTEGYDRADIADNHEDNHSGTCRNHPHSSTKFKPHVSTNDEDEWQPIVSAPVSAPVIAHVSAPVSAHVITHVGAPVFAHVRGHVSADQCCDNTSTCCDASSHDGHTTVDWAWHDHSSDDNPDHGAADYVFLSAAVVGYH